MIVIVSPAKKLDFEAPAPTESSNTPAYLEKSKKLIKGLKKCSASEISKLMKLSDSLTALNVDRYKSFTTPFTKKNSKPAVYAFKGDTYVGLDAETLSKSEIKYAENHFRILSGLYGILAPLDLIQPYRLEMGTKFSIESNKNLYEFWKEDLTNEMNTLLKKEKILVNCASNEYSSAIDFKALNGLVVTPVFKQQKGDQLKVVGLFAKRARGMMARFIIQNKITTIEGLKDFKMDGYKFMKSLSQEQELVFIRKK